MHACTGKGLKALQGQGDRWEVGAHWEQRAAALRRQLAPVLPRLHLRHTSLATLQLLDQPATPVLHSPWMTAPARMQGSSARMHMGAARLLTSASWRVSMRPRPSGSLLSASMAAACMARRAPTSRFSVLGTTLRMMLTAMRSSSSVSTSSQEAGP